MNPTNYMQKSTPTDTLETATSISQVIGLVKPQQLKPHYSLFVENHFPYSPKYLGHSTFKFQIHNDTLCKIQLDKLAKNYRSPNFIMCAAN